MSLIPFPNVPDLPGVPALVRAVGGPSASQFVNQFAGASNVINSIDGVSDYLSSTTSPSLAGVIGLPGVQGLVATNPAVAQVLHIATFATSVLSDFGILSSDDPAALAMGPTAKWGIFDSNGSVAVEAESVISFEFTKDYRISDYPVAPNGFNAYNKVETPYEQRVSLARGDTQANRVSFLQDIDDVLSSTDLFTIVTPEATYQNANVIHADFRRTSDRGVTLIVADLIVQEVRVTATQAFSNTKNPISNANQNGGTVQPTTPTTAQANAAAGGAH